MHVIVKQASYINKRPIMEFGNRWEPFIFITYEAVTVNARPD